MPSLRFAWESSLHILPRKEPSSSRQKAVTTNLRWLEAWQLDGRRRTASSTRPNTPLRCPVQEEITCEILGPTPPERRSSTARIPSTEPQTAQRNQGCKGIYIFLHQMLFWKEKGPYSYSFHRFHDMGKGRKSERKLLRLHRWLPLCLRTYLQVPFFRV